MDCTSLFKTVISGLCLWSEFINVTKIQKLIIFQISFGEDMAVMVRPDRALRTRRTLRRLCSLYEQKNISLSCQCDWPHRALRYVRYVSCVAECMILGNIFKTSRWTGMRNGLASRCRLLASVISHSDYTCYVSFSAVFV
jgi:hypothetical protein